MVSSGGRLGADLMKQVTQRPADTVELFFFSSGEKKPGGGRRRWKGRCR